MKRRKFLQTTAATTLAAITHSVPLAKTESPPAFDLEELTITDL